jgi:hypothetical protein
MTTKCLRVRQRAASETRGTPTVTALRQRTVASIDATTIKPPPAHAVKDIFSPSHRQANNAPNAGSLPVSNATRAGLLRLIA